jgi:hypothetical protein
MVKRVSRVRRLVLLAAVTAVVARILKLAVATDRSGGELLPSIRGDTWPPVPVNPVRRPDPGQDPTLIQG